MSINSWFPLKKMFSNILSERFNRPGECIKLANEDRRLTRARHRLELNLIKTFVYNLIII